MCGSPPSPPPRAHACSDLELLQVSEQSVWLNGDEITNEGKTCIVVPDNCILEVCGLKFALERIPDDTSREKNTTGDDEDEDADVGE